MQILVLLSKYQNNLEGEQHLLLSEICDLNMNITRTVDPCKIRALLHVISASVTEYTINMQLEFHQTASALRKTCNHFSPLQHNRNINIKIFLLSLMLLFEYSLKKTSIFAKRYGLFLLGH